MPRSQDRLQWLWAGAAVAVLAAALLVGRGSTSPAVRAGRGSTGSTGSAQPVVATLAPTIAATPQMVLPPRGVPPAPAAGVVPTVAAVGSAGTPAPAAPADAIVAIETREGRPHASDYLDDRSTPEQLMRSYVNAINRKEYVRAYGYWDEGAVDARLPPLIEFREGYEDTESVQIEVGRVDTNAGAGQIYYSVPAVLNARTRAGTSQTFVGCYTLHLSQPAIQDAPPFRPLAIERATIDEMVTGDPATLLRHACPAASAASAGSPVTPSPGDVGANRYLDDRSDPVQVLRSLFNALNRQELNRAYSYWEPGPDLLPYQQFKDGYLTTSAVDLRTGAVTSRAETDQLLFSVPVILSATTAFGESQTYAGCYHLRLARPSTQIEPPYRPLAVRSANVRQIASDADSAPLLADGCGD